MDEKLFSRLKVPKKLTDTLRKKEKIDRINSYAVILTEVASFIHFVDLVETWPKYIYNKKMSTNGKRFCSIDKSFFFVHVFDPLKIGNVLDFSDDQKWTRRQNFNRVEKNVLLIVIKYLTFGEGKKNSAVTCWKQQRLSFVGVLRSIKTLKINFFHDVIKENRISYLDC